MSFQVRGEEAEREFATAATLADSDSLRLRVVHARAGNLHLLLARMDEACAVLDTAKYLAGAEVELLGVRALFAAAEGRLEEAEAAGRRVLDARHVSAQAESYAAWALIATVGLAGHSDQVSALAARATAAARRAPETAANQTNIAWIEVFVLGLAGQLEQARETVDRLVATLSGKFAAAYRPIYTGWLALLEGRVGIAAGAGAAEHPRRGHRSG